MHGSGYERKGVRYSSCPSCGLKGLYESKAGPMNCKYCRGTGRIQVRLGARSSSSMPIPAFSRETADD